MDIVFSSFGNIKIYLLAIGWLIALATYTWQFHHSPGAKQQVYLQLCKICCLIVLLLLNENNTLHNKVLLFLTFKGIMLIMPVFWFSLIWRISRPAKKFPLAFKYVYLVIILFALLFLFANPWHGLIWQWFWLSGKDLVGVQGILGWPEGISVLLCAYTLCLNLHWIFTSRGIRHKQAIWFFLAESISFVGITSDIAFYTHTIPWVTLITSGCMTWCFYRWQLYNIFALAQKAVVADVVDGWLLVDEYGYIVDLNYAAQKILRELPVQIGGDFNTLTKEWSVLGKLNEENRKTIETFRSYTSGRCYYEIKKILLKKNEISFGQLLLFKDITLKKKDGLKVWNKKKKQSLEKNV
jgi:hypothetical protein